MVIELVLVINTSDISYPRSTATVGSEKVVLMLRKGVSPSAREAVEAIALSETPAETRRQMAQRETASATAVS